MRPAPSAPHHAHRPRGRSRFPPSHERDLDDLAISPPGGSRGIGLGLSPKGYRIRVSPPGAIGHRHERQPSPQEGRGSPARPDRGSHPIDPTDDRRASRLPGSARSAGCRTGCHRTGRTRGAQRASCRMHRLGAKSARQSPARIVRRPGSLWEVVMDLSAGFLARPSKSGNFRPDSTTIGELLDTSSRSTGVRTQRCSGTSARSPTSRRSRNRHSV
jgi:hypothetical protein